MIKKGKKNCSTQKCINYGEKNKSRALALAIVFPTFTKKYINKKKL